MQLRYEKRREILSVCVWCEKTEINKIQTNFKSFSIISIQLNEYIYIYINIHKKHCEVDFIVYANIKYLSKKDF
jgi:hypothetical protein